MNTLGYIEVLDTVVNQNRGMYALHLTYPSQEIHGQNPCHIPLRLSAATYS